MKFSEMNNEQAADALVRLAAPIGNICDDEKITNLIMEYKGMENTPMIKVIGKFLPQIVGVVFKTHRSDMFEIVGALTMQTKDKAAKMNFLDSVNVIKESLNDEALMSFFPSLRRQTKKSGEESAQT